MRISPAAGTVRVRARLIVTLAVLCGVRHLARQASRRPAMSALTLSEGTSMAAALSPDARTLAIDLLGALWTLGIDGGPARRILDDGYDAHLPSWSPDGKRIAFQAYLRDTWHIWTVNADGTGLQEVTSGPFDDREPHWSPDGARLAFSSDRGGNYDVWTLTLADRGSAPAHDQRGQRQHAGVVARRAGDCVRVGPRGAGYLRAHRRGERRTPAGGRRGGGLVAVVDARRQDRRLCVGERREQPADGRRRGRERAGRGRVPLPRRTGSAAPKCSTRPTASSSAARAREARRGRSPFSADVAFTRAAFTPKAAQLHARGTAAGPRPDAPDDCAGWLARRVRRARRSLDGLGRGRRGRAGTTHRRRVRRDEPGVVARRAGAGLLLGPRRRNGPLDARPAHRNRSPVGAGRREGGVVAGWHPSGVLGSGLAAAGSWT